MGLADGSSTTITCQQDRRPSGNAASTNSSTIYGSVVSFRFSSEWSLLDDSAIPER